MKIKKNYPKRIQTGETIFNIIRESIESTPVTAQWIGQSSHKATEAILKFMRSNFRRRVSDPKGKEPETIFCIRCSRVSEVNKNGVMACRICGSFATKQVIEPDWSKT